MMQADDSLPTRLTCGVEGSHMTTREGVFDVYQVSQEASGTLGARGES
jgi:hypothetical protein